MNVWPARLSRAVGCLLVAGLLEAAATAALTPGSREVDATRKTESDEMLAQDKVAAAPAARDGSSVKIEFRERFVKVGQNVSFEILVRGADLLGDAEREKLVAGLVLQFPGFETQQRVVGPARDRLVVTGRALKPGFLTLRVQGNIAGSACSHQDYLVATPAQDKDGGAFKSYGYYVFLGQKGPLADNSLARWRLEDWKKFADWMGDNGADQLWMMLNCYYLAYPSRGYSELSDQACANVKENFLKEFIDYAHGRGVRVYLSFTCDDYAEGFGKANPDALRVDANGQADNVSRLCLEHAKVRDFILGVVREAFHLYPNADGISIHPNESGPDRHNPESQEAYRRDTGHSFAEASATQRTQWYVEQCAELAAAMHGEALAVNCRADCVIFDCPWFDEYAAVFDRKLPGTAKICVWHYLHHGTYLQNPKLRHWVEAVGKDRVVFMPNGFNYGYPPGAEAQLDRHVGNDRLLSVAQTLGYRSCVYYVHFQLDSQPDLLRDLLMAKFPTSTWAAGPGGNLIEDLHASDIFTVREKLLGAEGNSRQR